MQLVQCGWQGQLGLPAWARISSHHYRCDGGNTLCVCWFAHSWHSLTPHTISGAPHSVHCVLAGFVCALLRYASPVAALQIHTPATGTTAIRVPAGSNVIDVLKSLGNFQTFLLALQVGLHWIWGNIPVESSKIQPILIMPAIRHTASQKVIAFYKECSTRMQRSLRSLQACKTTSKRGGGSAHAGCSLLHAMRFQPFRC
jgi:hypothetical protein